MQEELAVRTPRGALITSLLIGAAVGVDLILAGDDRRTIWGWDVPLPVLVALLLFGHQALWLRTRRPQLALGIEAALSLVSLVVPLLQPVAGLLIALFAASRTAPRPVAAVPLVVALLPLSVHSYATALALDTSGDGVAAQSVLGLFAVWLTVAAVVWGAGRLLHHTAARAEDLHRLQREQAEAELREERLRIARELHDSVAGGVTGMLLQASVAQRQVAADPSAARDALARIEATGVAATEELQRMLRLLHEPGSDTGPGLADVDRLISALDRSEAGVRLRVEGEPGPLQPEVDLAGYRVVQEALNNAAKHAPGAPVDVRLGWQATVVRIEVRNLVATASPNTPSTRLGLAGLADRVAAVGGTFTAGPTADGFAVTATLPRPGVLG